MTHSRRTFLRTAAAALGRTWRNSDGRRRALSEQSGARRVREGDHRDEGVAGLEPAELGVPSGYSWKTARRVVPGLADVRTRHAGVSLVASHVSVLVRTDHPQTVGRSEF